MESVQKAKTIHYKQQRRLLAMQGLFRFAFFSQCESKTKQAKSWALAISQQCDELLGPMADVVEHCEVLLPTAADQLRTLIDQLRLYADQPRKEG